MIDVRQRDRFADELWTAGEQHFPIEPISERESGFGVEDAYAVQSTNVERLMRDGRTRLGRKVGLTSQAMQQMLGVSEPDFGVLLDDMFVANGGVVDTDRLLQPRIEAEIAFRMRADLQGPDVTMLDALDAIDGAAPALEIIDSRVVDWRIGLVDTIADNASCGLVVVGSTFYPVVGRDLRLIGGVIERNGVLVDHGVGAAVLGHPAACVAWLANKLSEFGDSLQAGEVILPGAVHRAIDVVPGDEFRAEFDGLGSVCVRFADRDDA